MYDEPSGIDRARLIDAFNARWGIPVDSLRYEPLGFGTHHYSARDPTGKRWFVNVDELHAKTWLGTNPDDACEGLDLALRTALELRSAGLEFVHAPTPSRDGDVLVRVDDFAMSVYGFVDGRPGSFDENLDEAERRSLLDALGRLHAATNRLPTDLRRSDPIAIPLRERLLQALDDLGSTWSGGPFSDDARRLIAGTVGPLRTMLAEFDDLAARFGVPNEDWVVTHGEPHTANLIWTDDSFVLIDWDTVAMGPPERDLWMIEPQNDDEWNAYASSGGKADARPGAIELFRLWWSLAEIAGYIDLFRSTHRDDANTRAAWPELQGYVTTLRSDSASH